MEYRKFGDTFVVRMDRGEEILANLKKIAEAEKIKLAEVNALGAVDCCTLGVYDLGKKEYFKKVYRGAFEIVTLHGSINTMDGEFYTHIHLGISDADGGFYGGHLNEAYISVTCEMFIRVLPGSVDRKLDTSIGINLLAFEKE